VLGTIIPPLTFSFYLKAAHAWHELRSGAVTIREVLRAVQI